MADTIDLSYLRLLTVNVIRTFVVLFAIEVTHKRNQLLNQIRS